MNQFNITKDAYKPNSFQHKVLTALSRKEMLCHSELYEATEGVEKFLVSVGEFVTDCLSVMALHQYIVYYQEQWQLTLVGRALLTDLNRRAEQLQPRMLSVAAKKVFKPDVGCYDGAELQVVVSRKGAYDFLGLPSRFGNLLVPHPTAYLAEMGS